MDLSSKPKNNEPDYASWIRVFRPPANAPEFVKSSIVVDFDMVEKELQRIKSKGTLDGKVRVSLRESKQGNLYTIYDTYHRDKEVNATDHSPDRQEDLDPPF